MTLDPKHGGIITSANWGTALPSEDDPTTRCGTLMQLATSLALSN